MKRTKADISLETKKAIMNITLDITGLSMYTIFTTIGKFCTNMQPKVEKITSIYFYEEENKNENK